MNCCSNNICRNNNFKKKVVGTTVKEIFVPAIIVGTVFPTMIVRTAVPTKVGGTVAKKCLFPQSLLEQLFPQ